MKILIIIALIVIIIVCYSVLKVGSDAEYEMRELLKREDELQRLLEQEERQEECK